MRTFVLALVWACALVWSAGQGGEVVALVLATPVAVVAIAAVIWIGRAIGRANQGKGTAPDPALDLDPIRVFVWTKVGEFSDEPTRARQERAQELAKKLYFPRGRMPTVPVADRGSADVAVEIVSWEDVVMRLVAMLSVGAYTTQMVGAQGWTKSPAGDVAGQVQDWIKANRPHLIARRDTAS